MTRYHNEINSDRSVPLARGALAWNLLKEQGLFVPSLEAGFGVWWPGSRFLRCGPGPAGRLALATGCGAPEIQALALVLLRVGLGFFPAPGP